MESSVDRRLGALVGLAVGDALGAAVEFRPPGSFEPVTGHRGGTLGWLLIESVAAMQAADGCPDPSVLFGSRR